jgi:N-6 DNA Methylase
MHRHYTQAFEYWLNMTGGRPRYVVLCNFDELWIYDFDAQLDEPMDRVAIEDLPRRYAALNFLFADEQKPVFENDRREVTDAAAAKLGEFFRALVDRGESRERAQRVTLQCVMALFADYVHLLPRGTFTELVDECWRKGVSSYDLIGGLFRQMNTKEPARGGRFKRVSCFDGGLFSVVDPIELNLLELEILAHAADEDWSKVNPAIFGNLFQASMTEKDRHRRGAHYTHEADIQRVVLPTIVYPWRARIEAADTLEELTKLREELLRYKALDPACGSGNFLYIAYRELKRLEIRLLEKIHAGFSGRTRRKVGSTAMVSTRQFFGIDNDPFAVELSKVTLMLAKKLALDEAHAELDKSQLALALDFDVALPLDNLDDNLRHGDALFCSWPKVDAIIGNPPFQSKNKAQGELSAAYMSQVRKRYPGVPGRADYCVYWFRRAHDELDAGGRAGLVGTNTIRQNYSRDGGLQHIVDDGGTITDAVSTQVWPGDAVVYVSIVSWVKGDAPGKRILREQIGDRKYGAFRVEEVDYISSALTAGIDVSDARSLTKNSKSSACYQGQTHGHEGFLLTPAEAAALVASHRESRKVIHPYLIGEDLVGNPGARPSRFIIDLNHCENVMQASAYKAVLARLREYVVPDIERAAREEHETLGKPSGPRQSHAQRWWKHWRGRGELLEKLSNLARYIACSRVTKRPIFEFVDAAIHPSDVVMAFVLEDDYSFGILQSSVHWEWFKARCSTLKGDPRYTSNTVFDSFPWPQGPELTQAQAVAKAAIALRERRRKLMHEHGMSLRQLYASLEDPGKHPLRDAQAALDVAVCSAYGMKAKEDVLAFLVSENRRLAEIETRGEPIVGPGLPPSVRDQERFITLDCVKAPKLG